MAVILFCALDSAVYGAASVLYVPLSVRLGTGPNGYSYLTAGMALGGLLGAGLANRLSGASRLAPVIMGSICLQALPFLLTVPVHWPVLAAALQVVSGIGMIIVDVLAITSLQRDLPGDVLGRVLGIFDTVVLAGILLAALATGILLAHADVNVALVAVGVGIPVLALAGLPTLLRADTMSAAAAERLRPRVALLSELDLLAGADRRTLERLAAAAEEIVMPAGAGRDQRGRRGRRAVDPRRRRAVGPGPRQRPRTPRTAPGDRAGLRRRTRPAARHPAYRLRTDLARRVPCSGSAARTSCPPCRSASRAPRCSRSPGRGWPVPRGTKTMNPDELLRNSANWPPRSARLCARPAPTSCCDP